MQSLKFKPRSTNRFIKNQYDRTCHSIRLENAQGELKQHYQFDPNISLMGGANNRAMLSFFFTSMIIKL